MDGETTRRRAFQLLAGALEYPRPGLAGLLRFLAVCDDANLSGEIVHEALLPALERMGVDGDPPAPSPPGESQERARQGYWPVLQAVGWRCSIPGKQPTKGDDTNEKEPTSYYRERRECQENPAENSAFSAANKGHFQQHRQAQGERSTRQGAMVCRLQAVSDGGDGYARLSLVRRLSLRGGRSGRGGRAITYFTDRYSYSSFSSQFLENRRLFWGSVPWHYGIILVLAAHLLALVHPPGASRNLPRHLPVAASPGSDLESAPGPVVPTLVGPGRCPEQVRES